MEPLAPLVSPTQPAPASPRTKLAEAAQGFEAMLLRQMLASADKASFGDPLLGGEGLDTFRQMRNERFADIAAQTGALGLAKMLEGQIARAAGMER